MFGFGVQGLPPRAAVGRRKRALELKKLGFGVQGTGFQNSGFEFWCRREVLAVDY